jgi:fatty acid-binding protein DegV
MIQWMLFRFHNICQRAEKVNDSFVHVFDTLSASVGEGLVILKLLELREKSMDK